MNKINNFFLFFMLFASIANQLNGMARMCGSNLPYKISICAAIATGFYALTHSEAKARYRQLEILKEKKSLIPIENIKSAQQIKANEYSVNLIWINKKLNEDQRYIYPAVNEEDMRLQFLNPIYNWSLITKEGFVNLWYDREVTSSDAIARTERLIQEHNRKHPKSAQIILKNIRELPRVQQDPEVFSEITPIYFRVDLLRAIAGIYAVNANKKHYCVFADLDVKPLYKEEIFDPETMNNLKRYGIVMARGGWLGFENGFQIISYHNTNLINAMQWALIELNIHRAKNALNGKFYNVSRRLEPEGVMKPLEQICYDSYPSMFKYFYQLEGLGTLLVHDTNDKWIPYNKNIHGLSPFGLDYLILFDNFETTDKRLLKAKKFLRGWVPTKKVPLPASHF